MKAPSLTAQFDQIDARFRAAGRFVNRARRAAMFVHADTVQPDSEIAHDGIDLFIGESRNPRGAFHFSARYRNNRNGAYISDVYADTVQDAVRIGLSAKIGSVTLAQIFGVNA